MGLFNWGRKNIRVVRDVKGNWHITKGSSSTLDCDYLNLYKKVSVLQNVINIGSGYLTKYKFGVKEKDGTINYDSPLLDFIKKPNAFQSTEDFLKQYYVLSSVYGYVYQLPLGAVGGSFDTVFNLSPGNIEHDYRELPYMFSAKKYLKPVKEQSFKYNDGEKCKDYKYNEIIPFYDTVNGLSEDNNPYTAPSKIDSLIKELSIISNIPEAELRGIDKVGSMAVFTKDKPSGNIDGMNDTVPLGKTEKQDIKAAFNNPNDRMVMPEKSMDKLDLSIELKKIGLSDPYSRNQGIICQSYGLSNELYNYLTKGSTFENQEQAEIRYIQNYIDPIAQDLANSWTPFFGNVETPFVGTIDHAPTMARTEDKRAERAGKIADTLKKLVDIGYTKEQAVDFVTDNLGININNK